MMFRALLLLGGFTLAVSGGVSTIAYLNLLATGYDFNDYIFILQKG